MFRNRCIIGVLAKPRVRDRWGGILLYCSVWWLTLASCYRRRERKGGIVGNGVCYANSRDNGPITLVYDGKCPRCKNDGVRSRLGQARSACRSKSFPAHAKGPALLISTANRPARNGQAGEEAAVFAQRPPLPFLLQTGCPICSWPYSYLSAGISR